MQATSGAAGRATRWVIAPPPAPVYILCVIGG